VIRNAAVLVSRCELTRLTLFELGRTRPRRALTDQPTPDIDELAIGTNGMAHEPGVRERTELHGEQRPRAGAKVRRRGAHGVTTVKL